MHSINFPLAVERYLDEYGDYLSCPAGTQKKRENAVSNSSRTRVLVKYMMLGCSECEDPGTWKFLCNTRVLKLYQLVLARFVLAPTTVKMYLGQAMSFVIYARDTTRVVCHQQRAAHPWSVGG